MSDTPILGITELAESQAGKAISVNEALHHLEGVLVRVLSATTAAEPGSPAEGDVYILPASATGTDWAGNDGKVAHYYGSAWHFYTPPEGLAIYSIGDDTTYRYLSSAWDEAAGGGGASDFTDLGDVPSSYSGQGGKHVAVNSGATALEFVAAGGGGARNYLLNPDFTLNQRGFAGGSLSDGDYGFDRWRACNRRYTAAILALGSLRFFPMDETSGTVAYDIGSAGIDGAYVGTPGLNQADIIAGEGASVDFSTIGDSLSLPSLTLPTDGTMIMLFRPNWPSTDNSIARNLCHTKLSSGNYFNFNWYTDGNAYAGFVVGGVAKRVVTPKSGAPFAADDPVLVAYTWDNTGDGKGRLYVNSGTELANADCGSIGAGTFQIGSDATLTDTADADISHFALFDTPLSAAQIGDLVTLLGV